MKFVIHQNTPSGPTVSGFEDTQEDTSRWIAVVSLLPRVRPRTPDARDSPRTPARCFVHRGIKFLTPAPGL